MSQCLNGLIADEILDQLNEISEMTDEECENIEKELNQ